MRCQHGNIRTGQRIGELKIEEGREGERRWEEKG